MSDDWKGGGAAYLPELNAAEDDFGIPRDLLARVAFQECSWRAEVISGAVKSAAGAVGMMQLMPRFFPNAGLDWHQDIRTAAQLLQANYRRFNDWQLAVAAYNDGGGNIDQWVKGERALPQETEDYVADVCADVPVEGRILALKDGTTA